jgi:hypothetical protein
LLPSPCRPSPRSASCLIQTMFFGSGNCPERKTDRIVVMVVNFHYSS